MPYAYDWLTEQQKRNITKIRIILNTNKILLEDIAGNQKAVVDLYFVLKTDANPTIISECLEECLEILKTRSSPLKAGCACFKNATVTFGMSLLKYLNPEVLSLVMFTPAEPVNFEDFLNGLKSLEEGYRFYLDITTRKIAEEDLILINKFTSFSAVLSKLQIETNYLNCPYDSISNDEFNKKFKTYFFPNGFSEYQCRIEFNEDNPELKKPSLWKRKPRILSEVSEPTARSVFENPLLMKLILKSLEYFDIERLRKVNIGVRECVDTVKPIPHIAKFSIDAQNIDGDMELKTRIALESGEFQEICYWTDGNLSFVKGHLFQDSNYKTLFLNDFEKTLNHQNSCMQELIIVYECTKFLTESDIMIQKIAYRKLLRKIGKILKRREHPLKVRKFSMGSDRQRDIMKILPAIDKELLKTIELLYPSEQNRLRFVETQDMPFDVDQISRTDQWKNAEQLISKYLTIPTLIQDMNILNFANIEILVMTISSQDVFYLKTNLLKSASLQKFRISFWVSTIDESLHELIGEPYRIVSNLKKVWYFRIPNTDYYVHIALDMRIVENEFRKLKPKVVIFTRVAKEDTPFFELPMNQLAIN
ncbi:unnamed protein product [Caenorhabditis nigoni]